MYSIIGEEMSWKLVPPDWILVTAWQTTSTFSTDVTGSKIRKKGIIFQKLSVTGMTVKVIDQEGRVNTLFHTDKAWVACFMETELVLGPGSG